MLEEASSIALINSMNDSNKAPTDLPKFIGPAPKNYPVVASYTTASSQNDCINDESEMEYLYDSLVN